MPVPLVVRRLVLLVVPLVAVFVVAGCASDDDDDGLAERQADVAERGAEVMPFDLEATTHVFTATDVGGIQVVTANDPADQVQIELIRAHLREERDSFARGDFEDPAAIHGHDMPGVAELSEGYADITVTYEDEPAGARLTYMTTDPALVDAVHAWFDRQIMDHGTDAEAG